MFPQVDSAMLHGVLPFKTEGESAAAPNTNRERFALAARHLHKLAASRPTAQALHVAIQAMSGSPVTLMRKFSRGIAADGGSS